MDAMIEQLVSIGRVVLEDLVTELEEPLLTSGAALRKRPRARLRGDG